ncbi:MAG TPA: GAF domain-containing protein, partial [Thermoanaerobaculia bacterium]|nr:GAF domain-containing protein [Thermoanaerobaculia bacterium]
MARSTWFRVYQTAIVVVAALVFAWALMVRPFEDVENALFFAALVFIAGFLRVDAGESSLGFEAAVVFGALILFHDPAVVLIAVLAGAIPHAFYESAADRSWRLDRFANAAQLAVAYSIVGVLYAQAVARDAAPMAKVAGYILLVIGYVVVHLAFATLRRGFEGDAAAVDFRRMLVVQGRALLLVSPIVAIEVLLYRSYGAPGFAIAFLPVLLLAYAMRNEASTEQQNSELLRQNRDLAIVTESSTQILSAESDLETLRRLMTLLSRLAKMKACAVVTWESNPDVPGTVYRFGECLPTDQDVLRWVDATGFAQSAPSRAFIFQSDMRKFPLSTGSALQVLIGIQTPEVIYGILIYETEDSSILKAGSLNLLTLLVNQTALSLQDQLLRREMREKTVQLEAQSATMTTILDVSNSLIGQFDVDAALTHIAHSIRKALGFEVVVFAIFDPKRNDFVRRAHAGLDDVWEDVRKKRVTSEEITAFFKHEFHVSNSYFVSHEALHQTEHDFFVRPEDVDDSFLKPDEWNQNDMLIVPLMSGDQLIGYLSVRDPHDRRIPSVDKVKTLEVFATQAVTALQSAR